MIRPISHETWQQLRVLVRAKDKPVTGKEIRCTMSRRTRDGTFLQDLVDIGLIRMHTVNIKWQFATFVLTPAGIYAAEHGEYDSEPKTGVARKCEFHDVG